MKGSGNEVGVREKYVLYTMLYSVAAKNALIGRKRPRRPILPYHVHKAAIERANYILEAIGESFTKEEAFMLIED